MDNEQHGVWLAGLQVAKQLKFTSNLGWQSFTIPR